MKFISSQEILKQYKKGKRDFSNITCQYGDLRRNVLKGIIFKNADLVGTSLYRCNLTNADFSGANLRFCSIRYTTLKNAKFIKAKANPASFEGARLDNTDFTGADLSYSVFIFCERGKGIFENALLYKTLWDLTATAADFEEQFRILKSSNLPVHEILGAIENLRKAKNRVFKLPGFIANKSKQTYGQPSSLYSPTKKETSKTGYGIKKSIYSAVSDYIKKLEYTIENIKSSKEVRDEKKEKAI